jgi:hypothetical protein
MPACRPFMRKLAFCLIADTHQNFWFTICQRFITIFFSLFSVSPCKLQNMLATMNDKTKPQLAPLWFEVEYPDAAALLRSACASGAAVAVAIVATGYCSLDTSSVWQS